MVDVSRRLALVACGFVLGVALATSMRGPAPADAQMDPLFRNPAKSYTAAMARLRIETGIDRLEARVAALEHCSTCSLANTPLPSLPAGTRFDVACMKGCERNGRRPGECEHRCKLDLPTGGASEEIDPLAAPSFTETAK